MTAPGSVAAPGSPAPSLSTQTLALATSVMSRCQELAACSDGEPGCLTRLCFSPAMERAQHLLCGWLHGAGLTVRTDQAGNVIGRRKAAGEKRGLPAPPALVIGSHLDTVPNAGRYDGQLGILLGLAVVEALRGVELPFAVEVVAFSDEEGVRFATPYIGSLAFAGLARELPLKRPDSNGVTLEAAIRQASLNPRRLNTCARPPKDILGYIEVHIEQGPILEEVRLPIGVVSAIAGQERLLLQFDGAAGHAGTVPMDLRRDAGVAASRFVLAAREIGLRRRHLCVTVGQVTFEPGARNVIPGRATASLDLRHADDSAREAALAEVLEAARCAAAEEGCALQVLKHDTQPATQLSATLTNALHQAAESVMGQGIPRLVSGAGHDAVALARSFPCAMLFVRNPGGISHHPEESVSEADVAVALETLIRFATSIPAADRQPSP